MPISEERTEDGASWSESTLPELMCEPSTLPHLMWRKPIACDLTSLPWMDLSMICADPMYPAAYAVPVEASSTAMVLITFA